MQRAGGTTRDSHFNKVNNLNFSEALQVKKDCLKLPIQNDAASASGLSFDTINKGANTTRIDNKKLNNEFSQAYYDNLQNMTKNQKATNQILKSIL